MDKKRIIRGSAGLFTMRRCCEGFRFASGGLAGRRDQNVPFKAGRRTTQKAPNGLDSSAEILLHSSWDSGRVDRPCAHGKMRFRMRSHERSFAGSRRQMNE